MCSNESDVQLTVSELIDKLKQFPGDKLVYTEGCDCYGHANDVVKDGDDYVLITRS